jgi:hypothetical protein
MGRQRIMRLTKPLLAAMRAALHAALAGEGFDGGDFDGMDPKAFERALSWVEEQQDRRAIDAEMERRGVR